MIRQRKNKIFGDILRLVKLCQASEISRKLIISGEKCYYTKYYQWIITANSNGRRFRANKDFKAGSGARILSGLGINLTKLTSLSKVLCGTFDRDVIIKIVIFEKCKNALS